MISRQKHTELKTSNGFPLNLHLRFYSSLVLREELYFMKYILFKFFKF